MKLMRGAVYLGVLVVLATVPAVFGVTDARATPPRDITCGWCGYYVFNEGADTIHGFWDEDGDQCGWPLPDYEPGEITCSRCNGAETECHLAWEWGHCHLACGPGGGFEERVAAEDAATKVRVALRVADVGFIAAAVHRGLAGFTLKYNAAGGRLELHGECSPVLAVAQLPVSLAVRPALETALAEQP